MLGQAREGTPDKTGVGRTKDDGAVTVQRKAPGTGAHATRVNHEAHATRNQQGTCPAHARPTERGSVRNAWRSRAPGPHAHRNTGGQVVDGLRPEVWGQQKQSNDPRNNQHNPSTLLRAVNAQTAHPATFSTAPAHQPLGSANAETTPAGAPAAVADRKQRRDAICEGKNG